MTTTDSLPLHTPTDDQDMAEQAVPGHGIPSQDPDPAAQTPLPPAEAEREAKSVLAGGGVVGGAAIGAGVGMAVAGPVGVVVGGALGAAAGALGGAVAGAVMNPGDADADADALREANAPGSAGASTPRPALAGGAKL